MAEEGLVCDYRASRLTPRPRNEVASRDVHAAVRRRLRVARRPRVCVLLVRARRATWHALVQAPERARSYRYSSVCLDPPPGGMPSTRNIVVLLAAGFHCRVASFTEDLGRRRRVCTIRRSC